MSDLTDAAANLSNAATRANKTTDFFDDVTTLGPTSTVKNPNNNKTVPSVQKQVKDLFDALPPTEEFTELEAAALAAGTTYDNITYSTNLVDEIKGYIFDATKQVTYAVPEAAKGQTIISVASGVLTASGGVYSLNSPIKSFKNSVQEMLAVSHRYGEVISTGATTWRVLPASSSKGLMTVNGNKVIPLNGLWLADYGINVSDETTNYSYECDIASQNLSDLGGGSLIASSKINLGTTGFTVQKGVALRGTGQSSAQFLYSGTGEAITLLSTENLGAPTDDAKPHAGHNHKGFSIVQTGTAKTGTGLWNKHNTRSKINNVTIKGFERGIDASGACWINSIRNCWIVLNKYGIYVGATDSSYIEPEQAGFTTLAFQGLNASAIKENELQANDYGVYCPAYPLIGSANVAAKLVIDNNSIEGGGQAVQFTPNQAGLTISNNYTEVNGVGMTVSPSDATLANIDLIMADFVQNKYAGSPTQVGLNISDNHQISPSDNIMTYIDRAGNFEYKGNDTLGDNLVIKQTSANFSVGPYMISSNSGVMSLDGASTNNTISNGNGSLGNFIGASREFEFKSEPILSNGIELHPSTKLPTGTTTPSVDLVAIANNTFYWSFVSGSGYPNEAGSTSGSLYGYKNTTNDYQYSWQEYVSAYGVRYRRNATSSTTWGAFVAL